MPDELELEGEAPEESAQEPEIPEEEGAIEAEEGTEAESEVDDSEIPPRVQSLIGRWSNEVGQMRKERVAEKEELAALRAELEGFATLHLAGKGTAKPAETPKAPQTEQELLTAAATKAFYKKVEREQVRLRNEQYSEEEIADHLRANQQAIWQDSLGDAELMMEMSGMLVNQRIAPYQPAIEKMAGSVVRDEIAAMLPDTKVTGVETDEIIAAMPPVPPAVWRGFDDATKREMVDLYAARAFREKVLAGKYTPANGTGTPAKAPAVNVPGAGSPRSADANTLRLRETLKQHAPGLTDAQYDAAIVRAREKGAIR